VSRQNVTSSNVILPYGRQSIDQSDIDAVTEALKADLLTTGPLVDKFEQAFAAAVRAPYAVACGNGTHALHLAALACDIGPGDWVIVTSVTFLASANAVRYVDAEVVFADVDPVTGLINVETILDAEKRAGGPVKAMISVHLGGLPVDSEAIWELAQAKGWKVIEDSCHALGTRFHDRQGAEHWVGDGSFADLCTFSFHPVKTIAMGEGGAITTRNPALADRMRVLRSHGMVRHDLVNNDLALDSHGQRNPWYYEMQELGFNYRVPDLNCALGLSQLARLPAFVARRVQLVDRYVELLRDLGNWVTPIVAPPTIAPGWHLFRVLIDFSQFKVDRAEWMQALTTRGIGSQVHYIPVHLQPYYQARYGVADLPGAMTHYSQTLSLPLYPSLLDHQIDRVVSALGDIANQHG
jgi:UDP-4-amino-4,6-dideoxy-N-acetyl-beta-L-altrosamine transaminase